MGIMVALIIFVDRAQAFDTEQQDLSYSVGIGIVHMMPPVQRAFVEPGALVLGLKDAIANRLPKYSEQQLNQFTSTILDQRDKTERSRMLASNKDLLSYWMGSNIGKAMITNKKQYDFDRLEQGMVDEFAGAPHAISIKQMAKVLKDANQREQQELTTHK